MKHDQVPLLERLAGSDAARRLLTRLGLDSGQFVLFLGLLRTLSERREFMGNLGVSRIELEGVALFYAVFIGAPMGLLAFLKFSAPMFLLCNMTVTLVLLLLVVVAEAANTLYNPVEASVLAQRPVHSLTYAGAKIAHLLIVVLYLVPALAAPSAALGLVLEGTRWFWPITHLAAVVLAGLFMAFLVCALYGWLYRLVPANRLRGITLWLQILPYAALPMLGGVVGGLIKSLRSAEFDVKRWAWMPLTWFVEIGLLGFRSAAVHIGWEGLLSIGITAGVIWLGLRSFSGNYFPEALTMTHGRSGRPRKKTQPALPTIIAALTGAPAGSGAFSFTSKMMRRDWNFRRNALPLVFYALLSFAPLLTRKGVISPVVPHNFSPALIFPHLFAMMLLAPCMMIPYTDLHQGSWIFLTAPFTSLRPFARGIYLALWAPAVGLTHLLLLPVLTWYWGWRDAAIFWGFSLALVSGYLAMAVLLISGLPFSNPYKASRAALGFPIYLLGGAAAAALAGLQWLAFQVWWVAILAAIVVAVAARIIVHFTLSHLESEIRRNLRTLQIGPMRMFNEIE